MPRRTAPASTPIVSRLAGTCPVCEAQHKLTSDDVRAVLDLPAGPRPLRVVHHGFERPGDGQIHGDCWGVGAEPYEVSADGTRAYLLIVGAQLAAARSWLARLQSGEVRSLTERTWRGEGKTTTAPEGWAVREDDCYPLPWDSGRETALALHSWLQEWRGAVAGARRQVGQLERELARVEKLIADWQPRLVLTIEELEAPKVAERAARKQARVDSGVKQRKPHLIADAFEAAQRSLRNDFDFTRDAAVPAIERDGVFAAFGLDVRADARDEPNREILSRMTDTRYTWTAPFAWPSVLA